MTIAIGNFPTTTLTGTTTVILGDNDGSQMPLATVLSYGLEHMSTGTTMSITDDVVAVIGGVAELIPLSDVISAGVPISAPLLASNAEGTITAVTLDSNWLTISMGAMTVRAFPANSPLVGFTGGLPAAVALGSGLAISAGTLSATGTVVATNWKITDGTNTVSNVQTLLVSGNGTVSSTGTAATTATLSITGTSGGGGSSWNLSDGTTTIDAITSLLVENGTLTGSSAAATLTVSAGGGGAGIVGPGNVVTGDLVLSRPRLSAFTQNYNINVTGYEPNGASGPLLFVSDQTIPQTSDDYTFFSQAAPTGAAWTVTALVSLAGIIMDADICTAIGLRDNTGKMFLIGFGQTSGTDVTPSVYVQYWNSNTSYNATKFAQHVIAGAAGWMRLQLAGGNLICYYSANGLHFDQIWEESATNFLGATLADLSFLVNQNTTGTYTKTQSYYLWHYSVYNESGNPPLVFNAPAGSVKSGGVEASYFTNTEQSFSTYEVDATLATMSVGPYINPVNLLLVWDMMTDGTEKVQGGFYLDDEKTTPAGSANWVYEAGYSPAGQVNGHYTAVMTIPSGTTAHTITLVVTDYGGVGGATLNMFSASLVAYRLS